MVEMSKNILDMFFEHGGYTSQSGYESQSDYISEDSVTSTYVPQAISRMNSLCLISVSVDTLSTTGDPMDDVIIAELALSIADSEYDKVHVDPETYQVENKHWLVAKRYMLDMYGIPIDGELKFPREVSGGSGATSVYSGIDVATLSI
jgi:hypothetical protein